GRGATMAAASPRVTTARRRLHMGDTLLREPQAGVHRGRPAARHIDEKCLMWSIEHMPPDTRDRILDGATEAIARHGLAKLHMRDVRVGSGVSRGTLYRYFPSRQALLVELSAREGVRFKQEMLHAIETAAPGPERLLVALQQAVRRVREHPVLQRLL